MDEGERLPNAASSLFREAQSVEVNGGGPAAAPAAACNCTALQGWLLACCQVPGRGGLRDKPGKHCDYYHTCYCLSGLSACQHYGDIRLGSEQSLLRKADPRVNVLDDRLEKALAFFRKQAPL